MCGSLPGKCVHHVTESRLETYQPLDAFQPVDAIRIREEAGDRGCDVWVAVPAWAARDGSAAGNQFRRCAALTYFFTRRRACWSTRFPQRRSLAVRASGFPNTRCGVVHDFCTSRVPHCIGVTCNYIATRANLVPLRCRRAMTVPGAQPTSGRHESCTCH